MNLLRNLLLLLIFFLPFNLAAQVILKGKITDSETNLPVPCTYSLVESESGKPVIEKTSNDGSYEVSLTPDLQYNLIFKADLYEEMGITFRINKTVSRNFSIEPLKEGSVGSLGDLPFAQGKAEITSETQEKLLNLVAWLKAHERIKKIEVRGHTDKVGDPLQNMKLSQMRAQAVVDFLIQNGIEKEKLQATGLGSTMPVEKTANPKNRRVEIKILAVSK